MAMNIKHNCTTTLCKERYETYYHFTQMSAIHDHKPSDAAIAEARELIEKIASDYGWISPEDRAKTPAKVLRALENAENTHAISARRLLERLQKSKTNFLLELIQNADDSIYTSVPPNVTFTITPTEIGIKYEEDGFTAEDVKAICGIGKSTRVRSDFRYSLGDEGLGFKSVFKVASRAHIQSGPYSFFFEHNVGETGMGLITPRFCERESPQDRGTKITLTLRKDLQPETILNHFQDAEKVLRLFTRKVKGQLIFSDISASSVSNSKNGHFLKTKKLRNLPHDGRRVRDEVDIVLAFPRVFYDQPLVEEQNIYAFCPLGKFGFPFIIQSDFLKDNQGKIDFDNARNGAIFDGVAVAFLDSVLWFCQHPTLQYCWMRYLPKKEDGPLASRITTKIEQLLVQTPILRRRAKGLLRKICELRIVPKSFKTLDGSPLLEDCTQGIYLDDGYRMEDVMRLKPLGLKDLTNQDILERVREDLASTKSKFKSSETTSNWHERIADFFLDEFTSSDMAQLQRLSLIPLRDGTYTRSLGNAIYFPHEDGIEIPDDLGLHIVDPRAMSKNSSRHLLFWRLGVVSIDTDTVTDCILKRYGSGAYQQWRSTLTVERSVCHLKYLYLTQELSSDSDSDSEEEEEEEEDEGPSSPTDEMIQLFDHRSALVPRSTDLYFSTEDEFGIQKLASDKFDVSFLNEAYFTTEPRKNTLLDVTWKDWLNTKFGVLYYPKLSSTSRPSELSDTVSHIANYQPWSFLGFLQTHWAQFSTQLNPGLTTTIADVEVPCKDDKLEPLHFTYLPSLESYAQQYLRGEQFPFLKLPCSLAAADWGFLAGFGVGMTADLDFHLQLLECICDAAEPSGALDPTEFKEPERVLRLYEAIQTNFTNSQEPDHDRAKIQSFLEKTRAIIVPYQNDRSIWTSPSDCVWVGPDNPLKVVLSSCKPISDNATLVDFFRNTVGIPNVNWMDLIDILIWNKGNPEHTDADDISATYQQLQALMINCDHQEVATISELLNEHYLVYIPAQKSWIAPEQCTWGSIAHAGGKINIDAIYPSLQNFFVDFLDVEQFSLEEVINKLARLWRTNPSINRIKMLIWGINSSSPAPEDLQCLRHGKVFPVRTVNGIVELFSWDDEFVVVDRQDLANAFEGQLNKLDFTLEEVHGLQWFIRGLDLHHRFLSHLVSEKSELLHGVVSTLNVPTSFLLRHRAHALFRYVLSWRFARKLSKKECHFESSRTLHNNRDLYNLLLQTRVFETDTIAIYLSIPHQGRKITVRSRQPGLFIDETSSPLRIFLPGNPQQRNFSYYRALPTKIFRFIMSETSLNTQEFIAPTEFVRNAVAVITDVLCVDESMLDDILTTAGIIQVPLQEPVIDFCQDIPKFGKDLMPSRDTYDAASQSKKEHKLVLRQTDKEVERH
ncbi:ATPase-like ATP-binding domain protein [Rutstroemia sp. NJR-2017a BVV2]|nr:ATPase-like ATP-binding domain protein [Rutstroemia sp. NJR-2017a BVV2]